MNTTVRRIADCDRELFLEMSAEFYSSDAVLHDVDRSYHIRTFDELMRSDVYLEGYIFEADGSPAGYALLDRMFSHEAGGVTVWIEELYLRSEYRGRGIGRSFFDMIEKTVPAARYRLEVEPDNLRAQALYRRMGYEFLPYLQMIKDKDNG